MIIYKVTNIENGKIYIGKTVRKLIERKNAHYNTAKYGSSTNFHKALIKYPKDLFLWDIIAFGEDDDELNKLEIQFIKEFDSYKVGYNMTEGGEGGLTYKKGTELYERTKHKLGKWKNGNPGATKEAIAKRVEAFSKKTDWVRGEAHPNYGRVRTDMRGVPANNSKPLIVDGVEYASTGVAARALGLRDSDVARKRCNSNSKKWESYYYVND